MVHLEKKRLWRGFWQLADPKIWIASIIPMLVGTALAYATTGKIHVFWFIVSFIGICLIEICKNAVNEYVDYESGVDSSVAPENRTPFSGGKKTIIQGRLSLDEVKYIAIGTFILASGIGLSIVVFREIHVLWIGIVGLSISVFYSLPPLKFSYSGWGEFAVGFTFGPLITLGMYVVMTGSFDYRVIITALPLGFLIANVLWINQYPDYEADKQGNKKNWVVRLGKKKGLKIYAILFTLAYISFIPISLIYWKPYWLLGLISIPLAIQAFKIAKKEYNNIPKLMPANAKTVIIYQITGATMIIAAICSCLGKYTFE